MANKAKSAKLLIFYERKGGKNRGREGDRERGKEGRKEGEREGQREED